MSSVTACEITHLAAAVQGAQVAFHATSYREWLATWPSPPSPVAEHAAAVLEKFQP